LISTLAPLENHIANGGEKLLGNASSIKRRPDGKVYISGQMQRHALFSAIDRLNSADPGKGNTYVSNGDGNSMMVEKDLRADMGGFLEPDAGNYTGRRIAPVSVTPAVALEASEVGRDLLLRLKYEDRDNSIATREFSQMDVMHMNYFLDVENLGISKGYTYDGAKHVKTLYFKHTSENERRRRTKLFIEATRALTDYANQARNATSGEPQEVLIVFDTRLSRKAARYFTAAAQERANILKEFEERGATYFIGDDRSETSVSKAYQSAFKFLESQTLYDPSGANDLQLVTFEEYKKASTTAKKSK